ncbi:MAG: DUF3592 domain-containing protein [Chloroflexota bacterium]
MQQTNKPSVSGIIQGDYLAMLSVMFPIVIWGMYIAIVYFGFLPDSRGSDPINPNGSPFFFYFGIIMVVVGIPLLTWRVKSIQDIFDRGIEVEGQITNIRFYRGRGRVEYAYEYVDKAYRGGNAIRRTRVASQLKVGDQVIIVIDRANPQKAVVRDLYL